MKKIAQSYGKPAIGGSDVHVLGQLNNHIQVEIPEHLSLYEAVTTGQVITHRSHIACCASLAIQGIAFWVRMKRALGKDSARG